MNFLWNMKESRQRKGKQFENLKEIQFLTVEGKKDRNKISAQKSEQLRNLCISGRVY